MEEKILEKELNKEDIMDEKKDFLDWIREHKKQLILAGISIPVLIIAMLALKDEGHVRETFMKFKAMVDIKESALKGVKSCQTLGNEKIMEDIVASESVNDCQNMLSEMAHKAAHGVDMHIRKLPAGYHASNSKIQEAIQQGILLPDGYTWVRNYQTGKVA